MTNLTPTSERGTAAPGCATAMGVAADNAVAMDQQAKKHAVFMAIFLSAPRASCRNARTSIIEIIRDALAGYKGVSLSTGKTRMDKLTLPHL
jgi:hypothetical protein